MATFTKLKSGDWGLRGDLNEIRPGATVTVYLRDGREKTEIVGKVVWSNDTIALATIAEKVVTPKAEKPAKASSLPFQTEATVVRNAPAEGVASAVTKTLAREANVHVVKETQYSGHDEASVIKGMERAIGKAKNGFYQLVYDIAETKKKQCPNPSNWLWTIGARFTLSSWMIPTDHLGHPRLVEELALWQREGVEHYLIQQADAATNQIVEICREKLRQYIVSIHDSLIAKIDGAHEAYEKAVKELTETELWSQKADDAAFKKQITAARAAILEAAHRLNRAIECAEIFDNTEDVVVLIEAKKEAIKAQQIALDALKKGRGW